MCGAGLAVLGVAASLAACGSSGNSSTGSGSGGSSGGKTIKVAAILIGPKNDQSFSQSSYDGILAAAKSNPQLHLTSVLENKTTPQQVADAVGTLAPINNVVVGVTSIVGPVFDQLADKYPNTQFIQVDGFTTHYHKNVTGFANDWGAPVYVSGVVAAHLTKSKVVGYVGGAETATDDQSSHAFASGVKSVDPSIKVLTNITGDYDDVAKAKAATAAMITDRADVILPYLDSGTAGAYQAGKQSGKNPAMFRITSPDCAAYPNAVGTVVDNNTIATHKLLDSFAQGSLKPGAIFTDVQDPSLQTFAFCPKYKSNKKVVKAAKDAIAGLNGGKIKLQKNEIWPRPDYPYREGFNGPLQNAGKTG